MTGLEIAAAQPFGFVDAAPLPAPAGDPLTALEAPIREAFARGPVVISFSGGRDSSAILAVAARLAQREGFDPPVAATHRFPHVPTTHEQEWQELVIRHLGVRDWEILELGDRLDVVGPIATAAVARHGPLSPPNAHLMVPLAELARGGTLLTGLDGDTLFGGWRWSRLGALARGAVRPQPRDIARAGLFVLPRAGQRRVAIRRGGAALGWLAPGAARAVAVLRARDGAVQPRRFDGYVDWARRRRYLDVCFRLLDLMGADAGARIVHPLADGRFLAAYAAAGGARGFGSRTQTMRALFAELIPEALVSRSSKATFDGVFLGRHARAFAAAWDGSGVDPELVRADVLREDWRGPQISFRTATLMQWLWLREQAAKGSG